MKNKKQLGKRRRPDTRLAHAKVLRDRLKAADIEVSATWCRGFIIDFYTFVGSMAPVVGLPPLELAYNLAVQCSEAAS